VPIKRSYLVVVVVVVVVMTSPSGTAYMGDKDVPKRWGIPPDSWIWRDPSLPRGSWQPFIDWGTTQGWLLLPTADILSTIVKRSMLTDVDKLSSCSRFSDSVVGFIGQKTQPTASKYWRKYVPIYTKVILQYLCRTTNFYSITCNFDEVMPY